jgi:hypothetical protein
MATRLDDNIEINLDFQQFEDEEPEQHSLTINETANRNTGEGDPFCHVPKTNFEKLMCKTVPTHEIIFPRFFLLS